MASIHHHYKEMLVGNKSLGKGELEAISICKNRGYMFSSMDFAALQFAVSMNIDVLDLQSILRALWKSGVKRRRRTLLQADGASEASPHKDSTTRT